MDIYTPFGRYLSKPKYNSSGFFHFVKNRCTIPQSFLRKDATNKYPDVNPEFPEESIRKGYIRFMWHDYYEGMEKLEKIANANPKLPEYETNKKLFEYVKEERLDEILALLDKSDNNIPEPLARKIYEKGILLKAFDFLKEFKEKSKVTPGVEAVYNA